MLPARADESSEIKRRQVGAIASCQLLFSSVVVAEQPTPPRSSVKRLRIPTLLAALALSAALPAQTLSTFPESDNSVTPVYTFINMATKTLDMTMYEFVDTAAQADLIALAKKGVAVRVILDQNDEK